VIEIASLTSKSSKRNGVAPPSHSNWSLLEPTLSLFGLSGPYVPSAGAIIALD